MMNTPARLLRIQGWAARPSALRCGVLLLLLVPTATVAIHTPARAPLWAWTENLLPEYKRGSGKVALSIFRNNLRFLLFYWPCWHNYAWRNVQQRRRFVLFGERDDGAESGENKSYPQKSPQ